MDYKGIYDRLIDRAKHRVLPAGIYFEVHHITPRCMNGDDRLHNLVELTEKEHLFAHKCLVKIYPTCRNLLLAVQYRSPKGQVPHWIKNRFKAFRQSHGIDCIKRNDTKRNHMPPSVLPSYKGTKVLTPDGEFVSLTAAGAFYGISKEAVRLRIKSGAIGWKTID